MAATTVFVTLEIKNDCVEDFLKIMEADKVGSRAEEGCLRFDVMKSDEQNVDGVTMFHLYEMYADDAAMGVHKTLPHYLAWAEFKKDAREPVASQAVVKMKTAYAESK